MILYVRNKYQIIIIIKANLFITHLLINNNMYLKTFFDNYVITFMLLQQYMDIILFTPRIYSNSYLLLMHICLN